MAYIGKTPVIGNFVKLDSITVVNGQAAYTMQNGGVNFTSYDNVNQFLVSLNGVLQAPTDSFTVSSSTLTFASNLSTGDVIDFVLVLGNSLDIGTPSDNTVTAAKIANSAVDLTSKVTGTLPVANGGTNLTSGFANGITSAQQWRISSNFSINSSSELVITGWEKQDQSFAGSIGSDFSVSSGVFTFPTTGIFLITLQANFGSNDYSDTNTAVKIAISSDSGSSYTNQSQAWLGYETDGNPPSRETGTCHALVNVADASTYRARFMVHNLDGTNAFLEGASTYSSTNVVFIKVG